MNIFGTAKDAEHMIMKAQRVRQTQGFFLFQLLHSVRNHEAANDLGRRTWRFFFFALVAAGRIRDRFFFDRFPKENWLKKKLVISNWLNL